MSSERLTARELAHAHLTFCCPGGPDGHIPACNRLTAAISEAQADGIAAAGERIAELETELGAYRHGYSTWTDEKGNTQPSARTLMAANARIRSVQGSEYDIRATILDARFADGIATGLSRAAAELERRAEYGAARIVREMLEDLSTEGRGV